MAARFFSRISCAFPAQTAHVLIVTAEPGQHIGRHKLLEAIGEGGIGVVYLAEQQEPMRRRIAWKFTKSGLKSHYLFRLESEQKQAPGEARAAKHSTHRPGISQAARSAPPGATALLIELADRTVSRRRIRMSENWKRLAIALLFAALAVTRLSEGLALARHKSRPPCAARGPTVYYRDTVRIDDSSGNLLWSNADSAERHTHHVDRRGVLASWRPSRFRPLAT